MLSCEWAQTLTRYDCQPVRGIRGELGLRIGTPFSLPDDAAITLYIIEAGDGHLVISDNGDTFAHLSALGLDLNHHSKSRVLRDIVKAQGVTLGEEGDFKLLTQKKNAPWNFARSITALLAVAQWAREQMSEVPVGHDLVAEAEPYILARNPAVQIERRVHVRGASMADHIFDFGHGSDVIDIISPSPQATGGAMRKVGDVLNGPFADTYLPLIIVDDRTEPRKAENEIGILASLVRTQSFSSLVMPRH
jgi:hypothetical protein